MKSFTSFLMFCFVITLLTGCAAGEKSGQTGASGDSGGAPAWSTSQNRYHAENEGDWRNIQYRNGQMYYSTMLRNGEEVGGISVVNAFSEGEEPTLKFALPEEDLLVNYAVDAQGAIYVLGRELAEVEEPYFLLKADENGEEIYRVPLPDFAEIFQREGLAELAVDKGGICAVTNEGTCLMWSLDGQKTGQTAMEWYKEGMNFGTGDFGLAIGKNGIWMYHVKEPKVFLQFVSPEQGTVYAQLELSLPVLVGGAGSQADIRLYSGYEEGIYVSRTDHLFLYDDAAKENTTILNWEDAVASSKRDQVEAIGRDPMGNLLLAFYDIGRKEGIIARIAERTDDEENGREILEIGYLYESDRRDFIDYVSRFNDLQDEYELRFHHYAGLTDLQLALVQGKGPDILCVASLTVEDLAAKGILEDLSPYLDGSEALSGRELLPSIRQGMTQNGGVRFIFPTFVLNVMVLAEGDAQGSSITTKDFLKLAGKDGNSYLYGTRFGSIDCGDLLHYLLQTDMWQYVDWQSGTCSFDDGRFAELLEEIKQVKLPENGSLNTEGLTLAEQMHQGLYHAMFCHVGNIYDYVELK